MRFGILVLLVLLFQGNAALGHEPPLPAPYQIEGLVSFKNDRYTQDTGLGLNPLLVAVDLGDAEGAPHPGNDDFATMTFVGSTGIARGRLTDIRKICDYLCGDGGQACHYVALYSLDGPTGEALARIGTPLMAIPGRPALAGFRAVTPEAGAAFPQTLIGRDFAPLAWTPYGADGPTLRITGWDPAARKVALEARWSWGDTDSAEGRDCSLRQTGGLVMASCDSLVMIVAGEAPLLLSYPDYNLAAAEVAARFTLGEATLYLVRLGLKAQTVFGLLYQDETGWHGLFRPRDYALLC